MDGESSQSSYEKFGDPQELLKKYQDIAKVRSERITQLERELVRVSPELDYLRAFKNRKLIRFAAALTIPFERINHYRGVKRSNKWTEKD